MTSNTQPSPQPDDDIMNVSAPDKWNAVLQTFPEGVRGEIDSIRRNRGCLSAETVQRVLEKLRVEIGSLMMQLLPVAQQYSVVPVSRYPVGAVAAGVTGSGGCSLYLGANFEFRNSALNFTVHAEQAAVNNAWLNGEPGVEVLAISAAPCGYCRQFLFELASAQQLKILLPSSSGVAMAHDSIPLTTFLPQPFGPADLGVTGGLMDPRQCGHDLELPREVRSDSVILAALNAAKASYAPYCTGLLAVSGAASRALAGVAIQLTDGSIYAGRHAENAAFNPSLSPLQSALAYMNIAQPPESTRTVTRCVLVENPTLASQLSATQSALAAYAPGVGVEYYTALIPENK